ncbi:histidinol-phosphate transaminase [Vandammella animalimorsus]|uniref:Histidinol-phosphate aminotransferase n=1 Tax=Vandammella animalimorsus TaxID=2029117 RepID=A0A3M6RLN7_9BURK|nr:histidinol-phosphate transaminase [Vandammella animalimorsus]RMX15884.1 histidinol-phosphate transaminase [Vandammella animalimorsus]
MNFCSDGLQALEPYIPGEQPQVADLVKLNTNENPYGPSPQVIAAIAQAAQQGLQLYPDPLSLRLRQAIAQRHASAGIDAEQVFVGNGSDEVLGHAFRALFVRPGRKLLMPDISYSFYKVYCQLHGIEMQQVPLREDWRIAVEDYLAIDPASCAGVVLANPNAPTGMALPLQDIERLAAHFTQSAVLIDEAYVDFGAQSAVQLVARYPNLLVVHTLSKSWALAGLRVGFAMAQAPLIEALVRVKDSFNSYPLGRLAQAGAQAALQDWDYYRDCTARIVATRQALAQALQQRGFEVLPSCANFLFVRHRQHAGAQLYAGLRERQVLVRHFDKTRLREHLRISIGTPQQSQALLAALDALL